MIMVQISIPVTGCNLDFCVDENEHIKSLKKELSQILYKKYDISEETAGEFALFSFEQKRELMDNATLSGLGIHEGAKLILV